MQTYIISHENEDGKAVVLTTKREVSVAITKYLEQEFLMNEDEINQLKHSTSLGGSSGEWECCAEKGTYEEALLIA